MAAELKDLPRPHYTLEEYFALEEASEARYEYWDGEIVCMSGGTEHHYIISDNLHAQLSGLLKGCECRAFSGVVPISRSIRLHDRPTAIPTRALSAASRSSLKSTGLTPS
jgi:Uma2 family endonuclease